MKEDEEYTPMGKQVCGWVSERGGEGRVNEWELLENTCGNTDSRSMDSRVLSKKYASYINK